MEKDWTLGSSRAVQKISLSDCEKVAEKTEDIGRS